MVKCKAIRDGLLGTTYIHAGEEFVIDKCPRWAVAVGTPAPAKQDAESKETATSKKDAKPKGTPAPAKQKAQRYTRSRKAGRGV